ncbi:unnamed protein product [Kuraishia capsulata CBS 1993]|uniref:U3 small nucleolar RNA-associated protein 11 n=1 Tax=Kuraishia capsulata CBS 1993 TaxID=1382522 RepID=W6MUW0_9ASCO|nr:uncharacterized protein KUCA_T00005575001 [Kuraishia capsulata CBS 1993]CDK29582.1 unnamed protein product [Kuraishia capsulata CBS 1993]
MAKLVHNVQKKQHRERSQPQNRSRLGLLEKKKDYKLRAENYHKKQKALSYLKTKAANRNEDEYYHAMTSRKTDSDGILHADRGNEAMTNEEVLLLKTQDTNYINAMRTRELAQIRKDGADILYKANGKHTVFVESQEDKDAFDPAEFFGTDERLLDRRENRLRLTQLIESEDRLQSAPNDEDGKLLRQRQKADKLKKLRVLEKRIEREQKLKRVQDSMNLQKDLMKKGEKKKVETKEGRTVFKWKNQRKR